MSSVLKSAVDHLPLARHFLHFVAKVNCCRKVLWNHKQFLVSIFDIVSSGRKYNGDVGLTYDVCFPRPWLIQRFCDSKFIHKQGAYSYWKPFKKVEPHFVSHIYPIIHYFHLPKSLVQVKTSLTWLESRVIFSLHIKRYCLHLYLNKNGNLNSCKECS